MTAYSISAATDRDIPMMIALERRATELYRTIGYDFCADADVTDADEHAVVLREGVTLVARSADGLAGFAMFAPLDASIHLDEIDVDPAHQRKGLARRLIAAGEDWAQAEGFAEMTLTTFRDVPWNAPFYALFGFERFAPGADRPGLLALIEKEAKWGFAVRPRIAMRKRLS